MKEWEEVLLTDVATKIGDGLHGTPKYDIGGDYYFINGNNLVSGKVVIKEDTKRVNKSEYLKHSKPINERTLLLGINGTIGNVAYYKNEKCMLGKSACYINVNDETDLQFIYYTLVNKDFQNYIEGIATGTTILNVPLKGIREYTVKLPSLPEQRAIASILSSLDDKIDLLHRQNATLEKMAETLFRQWFVEEAKEEWEEGNLGEVIEIYDKLRIPLSKMERDKKKDGPLYPYYGAAQIMDYINEYIFDGEYILLGEDGTVRTDEGYPVLQYATGKFWVNNHTHVIKAKHPYNNFFILNYLKKKNIDEIVTGAVQPKINQANLKSIDFPKYPENLVIEFNTVTNPVFNKIKHNITQIRTLTALRDVLLPKLMSGEVRVDQD